mgnify:CR=1 FL=1
MYLVLDTGILPACLYCHVGGNKSIVPHLAGMSKFNLGNEVSPPSSASVSIDQSIVKCKSSIKLSVLEKVLVSLDINNTVIFCNRKKDIDILSRYLTRKKFQTITFHGDLVQTKRNEALNNFKNGSKKIMIASDVAGRGLDVENISHVINYDVPNIPEDYVHRIGRTGRAGKKGVAITLVTKEDFKSIN